jgi:uncharacterized HAD superfamily protein
MIIGCDVDGVLADFDLAFCSLIRDVLGNTEPLNRLLANPNEYPDSWNYHLDAGVSLQEDERLWNFIRRSNFWARLQPTREGRGCARLLQKLADAGHTVYFITAREGDYAKEQTEEWLNAVGIRWPTVIVVKHYADKAEIVKALDVDLFIDDKPEACDLAHMAGMRDVILYDRPHNRVSTPPGVQRVVNLEFRLQSLLPVVV